MSRLIFGLVLSLVVSAFCGRQAYAHALASNTARVSLRDGNLTIHLRIDIRAWVGADALLDGTRIRLDDVDVPLKIHRVPSHEAVVEAAAGAAIETDLRGHRHSRLLSATLESASSGWRGDTLDVQFPSELGPVLVTFVQPKTQQLDAGAAGRFDVLTRPTVREAEDQGGVGWLIALLAAAFSGAWLVAKSPWDPPGLRQPARSPTIAARPRAPTGPRAYGGRRTSGLHNGFAVDAPSSPRSFGLGPSSAPGRGSSRSGGAT